MTVAPSDRVSKFLPTTPTTDFNLTWPVFSVDEIEVEVNNVKITAFSVLGSFSQGRIASPVVRLAAAANNVPVVIVGNQVPRSDEQASGASDNLIPLLERIYDRFAAMLQEIARNTNLSPSLPLGSDLRRPRVPEPVTGRALIGRMDNKGWENTAYQLGERFTSLESSRASLTSSLNALAATVATLPTDADIDALRADLLDDISGLVAGLSSVVGIVATLPRDADLDQLRTDLLNQIAENAIDIADLVQITSQQPTITEVTTLTNALDQSLANVEEAIAQIQQDLLNIPTSATLTGLQEDVADLQIVDGQIDADIDALEAFTGLNQSAPTSLAQRLGYTQNDVAILIDSVDRLSEFDFLGLTDPRELTTFVRQNLIYQNEVYYWTGTGYVLVTDASQITDVNQAFVMAGDVYYAARADGTFRVASITANAPTVTRPDTPTFTAVSGDGVVVITVTSGSPGTGATLASRAVIYTRAGDPEPTEINIALTNPYTLTGLSDNEIVALQVVDINDAGLRSLLQPTPTLAEAWGVPDQAILLDADVTPIEGALSIVCRDTPLNGFSATDYIVTLIEV